MDFFRGQPEKKIVSPEEGRGDRRIRHEKTARFKKPTVGWI
jgi:hypothetical protein